MSPHNNLKHQKALSEARLNVLKRSAVWKEAFCSEGGKMCLQILKCEFYDRPAIADANPTRSIIKAAQRDLVRFIIDQVEFTGE